MEENSFLKWNDHASHLVSTLHNMFDKEAFVDVTLVTDEGLFLKVHRIILCAASPYFEDLLSQQPADTHITVILSDTDFEHLKVLVEFIYKGGATVSRSQLPALLELASSLKIKGIGVAYKCDQQQNDLPLTPQEESDGILLKIVPGSVKSVTQVPTQSEKALGWEHSNVVAKEEVFDRDSGATLVYESEENNWIGENRSFTELLPVPLSSSSSRPTDSPEKKSDNRSISRSISKENKSHRHNPSSKPDFSTRPSASKRTSPWIDEVGSSGKKSLEDITLKQQEEIQVAPDFIMIGDGTPPVPILFKRDPHVAGEEEEDQDGMQCEELVEMDVNGEKTSQHSSVEDANTASSDEDCDITTCSTVEPKAKATKSTSKANSLGAKKQKNHSNPPGTTQSPKVGTTCDKCKRVFKYKRNLYTHMKNECKKEPSFSCTLCEFRTAWKSTFKKHLVRVHNINDTQLAAHGIVPTVRPEMPFKCEKCSGSYKNKRDLGSHSKICGLDPAFQCTRCDHRFKRKDHLRAHIISIHGIGPADFAAHGVGYAFQCNLCPFRGNHKSALQMHITTEHGK